MSKVLIIEDNPNNMLLIRDILESHGHTIYEAGCGMDGVFMARELVPDFIILDIQLPDINGDEVLVHIRADSTTHSIPVVAMTSFAMAGDREKLLRAGCDGYIEKPIDPINVMNQIRAVVERAAPRVEEER